VIQGIVTGVGFLGAGVIIRSEKGYHVHGLTTAACVWVTACVGAACAIAQWQIVVMGVVLVLVILVFGGPFEKAIDRRCCRATEPGFGSAAGQYALPSSAEQASCQVRRGGKRPLAGLCTTTLGGFLYISAPGARVLSGG